MKAPMEAASPTQTVDTSDFTYLMVSKTAMPAGNEPQVSPQTRNSEVSPQTLTSEVSPWTLMSEVQLQDLHDPEANSKHGFELPSPPKPNAVRVTRAKTDVELAAEAASC